VLDANGAVVARVEGLDASLAPAIEALERRVRAGMR
jgi:hypothetical protein